MICELIISPSHLALPIIYFADGIPSEARKWISNSCVAFVGQRSLQFYSLDDAQQCFVNCRFDLIELE